jgi:hypothetical protein
VGWIHRDGDPRRTPVRRARRAGRLGRGTVVVQPRQDDDVEGIDGTGRKWNRGANAGIGRVSSSELGERHISMSSSKVKSLEERIWRNVTIDPVTGCWNWNGMKDKHGRGQIKIGNRWPVVSRVAFELTFGEISKDINVLHTCDNPSCINPDHLDLGTQADNVADMMEKGRWNGDIGENNGNAKLTNTMLEEIKKRHVRGCPANGTAALAREFGVVNGTIQRIVNGHTRKSR